jgi:NaMN:DMB phosphoribosyltransferase/adenosyl cobinamide kinase/adenosyl cobinamide phosphate guanylyltransferase
MSTSRVLVLGGVGSGAAEVAESLVTAADEVTRLRGAADFALDPYGLGLRLSGAAAGETIVVDGLGDWLTAVFDLVGDWADPSGADDAIDGLASGLAGSTARLVVLVSAEVGLAVPATERDGTYAAALGRLNRAVAAACDGVALVIAGQPSWLKGPGAGTAAFAATPAAGVGARQAGTAAVPVSTHGGDGPDWSAHLDLVVPDEAATAAATLHLQGLDFAGAGLGALAEVVGFAGGTQGRVTPYPWESARVLLLHGVHAGGAEAGDDRDAAERRLTQAGEGTGPLALLAAGAGASIGTVECPPSGVMETGDALTAAEVDDALTLGWQLAEAAADEGTDLLVLAATGTGSEAAAVAVSTLTAGGEPAALLDRVVSASGSIDDTAWMTRCLAVRDALHRVRTRPRDPRSLLAMVGGGDIAVATGLILGATYRRTPVFIDGPVGIAAALTARDLGPQSRLWLLLPDHGGHPLVRFGGDVLGLRPMLHLRLRLGEGATALAALPLLRAALTVAAGTPPTPRAPRTEDSPGWDVADFPTAELPLVKRDS